MAPLMSTEGVLKAAASLTTREKVSPGIDRLEQLPVVDDIMENHVFLNARVAYLFLEKGFGITHYDEDHPEIQTRHNDGGQGMDKKFKILLKLELANIQPYRNTFRKVKLNRPMFSDGREIDGRLHVDAVRHHFVGTLIAVFSKRRDDRLLGNPHLIDAVIKIDNALHLIVDKGLESDSPIEIVPRQRPCSLG